MKYFYANIFLPENDDLILRIDSAARRLHDKLVQLNLKATGISEYNQRYLSQKIKNPTGVLQLNTWLIYQTVKNSPVALEDFTLVDYGGGSGLIALLAGELGLRQVIYNDIYNVSCDDVRRLADTLEIRIDHFVCGDIDPLIGYLKKHQIVVDGVVSYDVIEHIYDIEKFLKKLRGVSSGEFKFVFGSGANTRNPMVTRALGKRHSDFEFRDRPREWGHKDRDALKSYLNIRKEIIAEYDPALPQETVRDLAKKTRGLIEEDIIRAVDEFNNTGQVSYTPDHPTNTCDPFTGNWAEHLMDTERLKKILEEEGAMVEISRGYGAMTDNWIKNVILRVLNMTICLLGKRGIVLSPYFILEGKFREAG